MTAITHSHAIHIRGGNVMATRLTTQLNEDHQETLQHAADLLGVTLDQFVVQAALEKAEKVISNGTKIVLTRSESLRLLELIESPPPRNAKFLQAQERYHRRKDEGSTARPV